MNRQHAIILLIFISMAISHFGCDQNKLYDQYVDMEDNIWHEDSLVSFDFHIENASIRYPISYNIRYAVGYPYYNLYVTYYLEDSTSGIIDTELQELILFDKKTGVPLGDGLGDIFDIQIKVFEAYEFPYAGSYTLKVKQFMRVKRLPGIMSYGLRLDLPENE